jgi:hypothetical protein
MTAAELIESLNRERLDIEVETASLEKMIPVNPEELLEKTNRLLKLKEKQDRHKAEWEKFERLYHRLQPKSKTN